MKGIEGCIDYVEENVNAFGDDTGATEETVAGDETVVVRHTGRGTHEGECPGIEPTDRSPFPPRVRPGHR